MYTPVFIEPPTTWEDWWGCVRRFATGWYGVPAGTVGRQDPEVAGLARHLNMELPPGIHEWATFAGDLRTAGIFDRAFRDRYALAWRDDLDAVTLLLIFEQHLCWGVRRHHFEASDPPVDAWLDGTGGPWNWWRRWTGTTSLFALSHLLAYLRPAGGGFKATMDALPDLMERLGEASQASVDLGEAILFEDVDLVVVVGNSQWDPPSDRTDTVTVQAWLGDSRVGDVPAVLVELIQDESFFPIVSHGDFADLVRVG